MTSPQDPNQRLERVLESALGALSDWLELVRQHENERRAARALEARDRRDHLTRVVMMVLSGITIGAFFWLSHR
jgi:hypothetical protein